MALLTSDAQNYIKSLQPVKAVEPKFVIKAAKFFTPGRNTDLYTKPASTRVYDENYNAAFEDALDKLCACIEYATDNKVVAEPKELDMSAASEILDAMDEEYSMDIFSQAVADAIEKTIVDIVPPAEKQTLLQAVKEALTVSNSWEVFDNTWAVSPIQLILKRSP